MWMKWDSEDKPFTWRLLCSSFLIMACFLRGDYITLPKKELHRRLPARTALPEKAALMPRLACNMRTSGISTSDPEGQVQRGTGSCTEFYNQ